MAANKRTKAQRELALDKLSEMRLEGKSQNEMAQALGISQSQVSQDLKKLDQRCLKAIGNTKLHKAREVAKLDRLERLCNEGWKRSTEDKEIKIAEKTTVGEVNRTKVVSRQEKRDGNPAFIAGMQRCIEWRCKILGIEEAPKKFIFDIEKAAYKLLEMLPDGLGDEVSALIASDLATKSVQAVREGSGADPR